MAGVVFQAGVTTRATPTVMWHNSDLGMKREAALRTSRPLQVLVLVLVFVGSACGGSGSGDSQPDDPPTSATTLTPTTAAVALDDCVGFYLGAFGGDRAGPFALRVATDGSLSTAFVSPDTLGIDLSDIPSIPELLGDIGLVLGEDIILSLSGVEIAPGALAIGPDGVRLGTLELALTPAGSVDAAGVVTANDGAGISGDFDWATCTGSGEWVEGDRSGTWQVAVAGAGLTLSAGDCEGRIFVGVEPDLGGLDIDLDAFCLSDSVRQTPVEPVDRGIKAGRTGEVEVYRLEETVLFEFGSAALTPAASDSLATVAAAINEQDVANPTIKVIGHTDSIGSSESNLDLSKRRAEAVAADLATRLDGATITAFGLGETNPIARNANADGTDNPAGRSQNRRVEIIVIG